MITIVVGGQFGSEGKGSVVSWLAKNKPFDLAIRTGGPNAGHTFVIDRGNQTIKMRQLPCTWFDQPNTPVYLPAGAIIKREVFHAEVEMVRSMGYTGSVLVSRQAAVIEESVAEEMERDIRTGTTHEGIGATRALKCLRKARLAWEFGDLHKHLMVDGQIPRLLENRNTSILIESSQGFGLSMDGRFYPWVTSTNINPYALLAEAEVPFNRHSVAVWMVLRAFPIRIAGESGPLARETTWEALRAKYGEHIPNEHTTVTKKLRRVGEFDVLQATEAIERCRPTTVVLTFFDYLFPNIEKTGITGEARCAIHDMEAKLNHQVDYVGIGIGKLLRVQS